MQILGRPHNKKLQDDVFCLTEERNYFQSKYLEQISEITSMKEELSKAKREIQKLREEVMTASVASMSVNEQKEEDASTLLTHDEYMERQAVNISISSSTNELLSNNPTHTIQQHQEEEEKKEDDIDEQGESDHSEEEQEEDNERDEEQDERAALRENAAKLLQWADYRSSRRSSMSSVASASNSTARSSVGVPRTIQSTSLKEDVEEEMSMHE
mmetsp:Transcript_10365/g.25012  ORF Transcript_10365/g.25012 Transcript_10365/m.25012 type:complete len:214 (-) Transcript_10365:194-835(-)